MTFGSLFSGIGGMDLGLERAGWTPKWFVEIAPYCRAVLEKHWPDVKRFGDVRELKGEELEPVDLICGGFPCQPVSHAGKRKGMADARWLWPEFARILGVLRPRYALIENVPGLLTVNRGAAFAEVLGDLAALGYDAEWDSIPAAAFGAPHLRYRVFVVADAFGISRKDGMAAQGGDGQGFAGGGEGENVPDSDTSGRDGRPRIFGARWRGEPADSDWWAVEPDMGRVAHGIPHRVDRLRSLGNAVVPQVAEWIGRRILEAEVKR